MTRFEASVIMFLVIAIMLILFFGVVWKLLDDIKAWQKSIWDELHSTYETPELQRALSDLAVNVKGNYNTLEQQQEDIGYIKMRINHILGLMHPAHEVVKQQPCYAPNGICTNPQMDCINCPKRGTGGTWSTSTNTIKED